MTTTDNRSGIDRIAGAPISWGVCEVPGWGYQLTPDRVLAEMREVGLSATEFGPDGFLPADPAEMADVLAAHRLTAVGGFVPVVLHDPDHDPVPEIERLLAGFAPRTRGTLVLAAATGLDGYDSRPALDEQGWETLLANLDRLTAPGRRARRQRRAASARRHHGREAATRCSGCSRAPPSRCAWTPATC